MTFGDSEFVVACAPTRRRGGTTGRVRTNGWTPSDAESRKVIWCWTLSSSRDDHGVDGSVECPVLAVTTVVSTVHDQMAPGPVRRAVRSSKDVSILMIFRNGSLSGSIRWHRRPSPDQPADAV